MRKAVVHEALSLGAPTSSAWNPLDIRPVGVRARAPRMSTANSVAAWWYSLHSSYAYPGNLLDHFFSERNFSLAMTLFFSAYFPLLNALVSFVHARIAGRAEGT